MTGEFGVASGARMIAHALSASKIPHCLIDVKAEGHRNEDKTFENFSESNPYPINVICVNADTVNQFFKEKEGFGENKYNVGVWYWEQIQFPKKWKSSFNNLNEITWNNFRKFS